MSSPSEVAFLQAFFSGRVQGVGFRYQTLRIAEGFEVSGWVKNLDDGRVLLSAEGSKTEVLAFKTEIESQLAAFIKETEHTITQRTPEFSGFVIRR